MRRTEGGLATPGAGERRVAAGVSGVIGVTALPVLVGAGLWEGMPGILGAAVGLGFVFLLLGASALMLAWAVRRGQGSALGVLLGGALGRLILYAAVLSALGPVEALHRPSLAIATAVGLTVTLVYELRMVARTPSLFWLDTGATRS